MIVRFICFVLFFTASNAGFGQIREVYGTSLPGQKLNADSLRADSIRRINAFPECLRPYLKEFHNHVFRLDKIIRVKRHYPDLFVREVLEPAGLFAFGKLISSDTLFLNDSIRKKLDFVLRHENYFGFTNGKLTLTEQTSHMQLKNLTHRTLISPDGKAQLYYNDVWENYQERYYYCEGVLVAAEISGKIYTTETELSAFSDMRSLPREVVIILELEKSIQDE